MPPKRKANDLDEKSVPTTRRSTRATTQTTEVGSSKAAAAKVLKSEGASNVKRAKKTKAKQGELDSEEATTTPTKKLKITVETMDKDEKSSSKAHLNSTHSKESKSELTSAAQKPSATKGSDLLHVHYGQARAQELFNTYRDEEVMDEEVIGSEGLEKLCHDAQLDMGGPKPLILAWILKAKELGRFTKVEWTEGSKTWQLDSTVKFGFAVNELYDVLFPGATSDSRHSAAKSSKKNDVYDKAVINQYQQDPSAAYRKFYSYLFELIKPEQARSVDMEIATAIWGTILTPRYSLCGELIEFISAKKTYRGVNRDLWTMTLEFCQEFQHESLEKYETDGAWPTLMDDFVMHRKSNLEGS